MRNSFVSVLAVAGTCVALAAPAAAAIVVSQQAAQAPTYATFLDFNSETPGFKAANTWAGLGLASLTDGGNPGVSIADPSGSFPWINSNAADGFNFGLFFAFSAPITEASFQLWSSAGPPGPFGGLSLIFLDANDNILHVQGVTTPVWGGAGNSWFNVTTNGGSEFTQIRVIYGGFGQPQLWMDNISWNAVPTPGALALLGLAAFGGSRRRR